MAAYYNEHDPYAAQWLRNLIEAGHIAPGIVDERSIEDVTPRDLAGFSQCHFFAGVGVWSLALRRAGWSDDQPVWTGSCPCQPFSAAGKGNGFSDERHLWPAFHHLIEQCRPARVFGEQVASKDADPWLDLVQDDLEAMGYAFGAVAFPAAGIGAPHIRDRTYWMADAESERCREAGAGGGRPSQRFGDGREFSRLGNNNNNNNKGLEGLGHGHQAESGRDGAIRSVATAGESGGVEHPSGDGREQRRAEPGRGSAAAGCTLGGVADDRRRRREVADIDNGSSGTPDSERQTNIIGVRGPADWFEACPTNGHWRDADWLLCRDGKWRPVEPGTFPLAHGAPARVGRLRAYGNAIVAAQAEAFIRCYLESLSA
jgi:DNA (cytosine-5)-methyltransferase 1